MNKYRQYGDKTFMQQATKILVLIIISSCGLLPATSGSSYFELRDKNGFWNAYHRSAPSLLKLSAYSLIHYWERPVMRIAIPQLYLEKNVFQDKFSAFQGYSRDLTYCKKILEAVLNKDDNVVKAEVNMLLDADMGQYGTSLRVPSQHNNAVLTRALFANVVLNSLYKKDPGATETTALRKWIESDFMDDNEKYAPRKLLSVYQYGLIMVIKELEQQLGKNTFYPIAVEACELAAEQSMKVDLD